jgi:sugar lactone lactonase YvrE
LPAQRLAANLQRIYSSSGAPDDILTVGATTYLVLINAGKIVALSSDGSARVVASGLSQPEGLGAALGGALYVVEQTPNRVDLVTTDGSNRVTPIKSFPRVAGRLGIDSIHELGDGRLLVPNSPEGKLYVLDPASGSTQLIASGLSRPVDAVAFDGGYAVADEQLGLVLVPGNGSAGYRRLASASIADDLVIDAAGDLLVTSMGSNTVLRYRAGTVEVIARGFNQLQGLALRSDGSLLVSDEGLQAVMVVPAACLE